MRDSEYVCRDNEWCFRWHPRRFQGLVRHISPSGRVRGSLTAPHYRRHAHLSISRINVPFTAMPCQHPNTGELHLHSWEIQ